MRLENAPPSAVRLLSVRFLSTPFQNTVLMVRFVINHMLSIENQHFRENIYIR
jgi:hypothetical protein